MSFRKLSSAVLLLITLVLENSLATAESKTFRFAATAAPTFRFVGGDLPCEVTAYLSGDFTLVSDGITNAAVLELSRVTMHSAQTELFGTPYVYPEQHFCNGLCESIEGSTLASIMPGIDSEITGLRVGPGQYRFGPELTDNNDFMREFVLNISPSSNDIFGSSLFYGDDGPSYFITGSVVAVPEPSAQLLSAMAFVTCVCLRCRDLIGRV